MKRRRPEQGRRLLRIDGSLYGPSGPLPHQALFHESFETGAKVSGLLTGVQAGKSAAMAVQALRFTYGLAAVKDIPVGWIAGPTHDVVKNVMWPEVLERCYDLGVVIKEREDLGKLWLVPPDGCASPEYLVQFRSAEKPQYLRGPRIAWALIDELRDVREEAYNVLRSRLLKSHGPLGYGTTPLGAGHWMVRRILEKAKTDPLYRCFRATTFDNIHLPPEAIEELRRDYPGEYGRQELYGELITFSDLVYGIFSRDAHQIEPDHPQCRFDPASSDRLYAGVDFGYKDPFCCLWFVERTLPSGNRRYVILDELYAKGMLAQTQAARVLSHELNEHVKRHYCDPNALASRLEIRQAGLDVRMAPRERDLSNSEGIRFILHLMQTRDQDGLPLLLVSSRCRNLIKEFGAYCWHQTRNRNSNERPRDYANHACDALRYGLLSRKKLSGKGLKMIDPDEFDALGMDGSPESPSVAELGPFGHLGMADLGDITPPLKFADIVDSPDWLEP